MTASPVGAPQVGRELDALVAEKVMGWTVNRTADRHWHTVGATGRERNIQIGSDCCAGQHYDDFAFNPSQSIGAAWAVVAALDARGKSFSIERRRRDSLSENVPATWLANFWAPLGVGESESAAHAICLAALRAVGALTPQEPRQ